MIKILITILLFSIQTLYANECKTVPFPIKNSNYTNQEAYLYFQNSDREALYSYYYDAILTNKSPLKNQLYKYLYKTETAPNKKAIIETLFKANHMFSTKNDICDFVNKLKKLQ